MSFSKAFKYPFTHVADVVALVLIMTIALAVFLGIALNSYDWTPILARIYELDPNLYFIGEPDPFNGMVIVGILGVVVVVIMEGFWLSGYSLNVIRTVMDDVESLPQIDFLRNLKDGFYLFVSSLIYWAIFAAILVIAMVGRKLTLSAPAPDAIFVVIAAFVTVVAAALMGWAYLIGMARFAIDEDYRSAWQIRQNLRLAREYWLNGASLLLFMAALTFVYGFLRGIVDGLFGGVAGMAGITLSIVIYYFFNLFQHFSTQHLIAHFAIEIGLNSEEFSQEKAKIDYA